VPAVKKRDFSVNNKLFFSQSIMRADWNHLYSFTNVDKAFNYFIKKLKRIYNKSFPYKVVVNRPRKSPWLTKALLTSIRTKNKLYLKTKSNPGFIIEYKQYKNKLCKLIRAAKFDYHKSMLSRFKSNSAKLWSHLNSIIKPKTSCDIPLSPDTLNDYFTSVFQQAPSHNSNDKLTIPNNAYIKDSMVLFPITLKELHQTCLSISNSSSVGCDGLNPMILKDNFALLSNQLFYIFNMSFEQGVFPQMLKSALVTPIFKSGSH
jgi:hypothetical protein